MINLRHCDDSVAIYPSGSVVDTARLPTVCNREEKVGYNCPFMQDELQENASTQHLTLQTPQVADKRSGFFLNAKFQNVTCHCAMQEIMTLENRHEQALLSAPESYAGESCSQTEYPSRL